MVNYYNPAPLDWGEFWGYVRDKNQVGLASASVKCFHNGNLVKSGITDGSGRYDIYNLATGDYTVIYEAAGYDTMTMNMSIVLFRETRADISLLRTGDTSAPNYGGLLMNWIKNNYIYFIVLIVLLILAFVLIKKVV